MLGTVCNEATSATFVLRMNRHLQRVISQRICLLLGLSLVLSACSNAGPDANFDTDGSLPTDENIVVDASVSDDTNSDLPLGNTTFETTDADASSALSNTRVLFDRGGPC